MEPDPDQSAAQTREDRAHASEQLEIEHGIKPERTQAADRTDTVFRKREHRTASDDDRSLGGDDIEQIERLTVLLGAEDVERSSRIRFPQALKHRAREHEGAHL